MKIKKILFVAAFLSGLSVPVFSQTPDERVGQLMNEENWIELYPIYTATGDSLSPFLRDFGKALLDNFYNRPEAACASVGKLLNERQNEMGFGNTSSMIGLLASNLSKLGKNREAADLLKNFCNQIEGQVDSTFLAPYRQQEQQLRELSAFDLYQWEKSEKNLILPFVLDSTGIRLQGTLNGKEQSFVWDTGAGVNMVTPEAAKASGMKILQAATTITGIKSGTGELALADEVKIGELVMRNVVFHVLDITSGHSEADKYLKQLNVILGVPILNRLQEVTLDFQKKELSVPAKLSSSPYPVPNLCLTGGNQLCAATLFKGNRMGLVLDTGSDGSRLGYDYYQKHSEELENAAKCDSTGVGGIGGAIRVKVYRIPDACLRIGEHTVCVDSLDVVGTPGVHTVVAFNRKGVIGMNLLERFSTVTINMKEMFVTTTPRISR